LSQVNQQLSKKSIVWLSMSGADCSLAVAHNAAMQNAAKKAICFICTVSFKTHTFPWRTL
jgi:hypothetical protein